MEPGGQGRLRYLFRFTDFKSNDESEHERVISFFM